MNNMDHCSHCTDPDGPWHQDPAKAKDEAACAFYEKPEHLIPAGPGRRLSGRPRRLTDHVPVRFDPDTIAAIRQFSDEDGMTVSAWVRRLVRRELEQRRASPGLRYEPPSCGPQTFTTAGRLP